MSAATPVSPVNRLLGSLPRKQRERFLERCEPVDLAVGDILCEPDQDFTHVYFPVGATISLSVPMDGHHPLEMGLIGFEGMLGVTLILGINTLPMKAEVQGAGSALRMTVPQFRHAMRANPALPRILNRYLYVLMAQLAQSAACARFHEVYERLARRLLTTHDGTPDDNFHLTHKLLANMLGVRRSGISIAANILQKKNIISYVRGKIHILDRQRLEAEACECYDAAAEDYARFFR